MAKLGADIFAKIEALFLQVGAFFHRSYQAFDQEQALSKGGRLDKRFLLDPFLRSQMAWVVKGLRNSHFRSGTKQRIWVGALAFLPALGLALL